MHRDVIIIGSGQAGNPLAYRLSESGKSVMLAERKHLGGTCINYGCTPTKTMIASARAAHVARTADRLGVDAAQVSVDFEAVMRRRKGIVEEWRAGIESRVEGHEGLHLVRGHARFTGPGEIEIAGEAYTADTIILNVGGRAALPSVSGLTGLPYLDNASVMKLDTLPSHLLVMGGGYIGCEFGQAFRRFGAEVSIIGRADHLLAREDPEVSEAIEEAFHSEGVSLHLGVTASAVREENGSITVTLDDGNEVRGTHLLVAAGRRPNTDDLGCELAGIELDDRGFVRVDNHYRTSVEGIYAVADVTGGPQFTHTAWDDHRILFNILAGDTSRGRGGRVIPSCVFTDPQVARVGMSEREAREEGIDYEVATMPFAHIARAIEIDEKVGIIKVIIDPVTERFLGAAIVGKEAGELIHIFAVLMQAGATARAVVDVEMAHPTFAEGVQSTVMLIDRYKLS